MICLHSTSVFGLFWTFIYPPLTFSLPPLSSQWARKLTKFCEQCQLESMNTIVSTNGFKRLSFFFFFFKRRQNFFLQSKKETRWQAGEIRSSWPRKGRHSACRQATLIKSSMIASPCVVDVNNRTSAAEAQRRRGSEDKCQLALRVSFIVRQTFSKQNLMPPTFFTHRRTTKTMDIASETNTSSVHTNDGFKERERKSMKDECQEIPCGFFFDIIIWNAHEIWGTGINIYLPNVHLFMCPDTCSHPFSSRSFSSSTSPVSGLPV